MTTAQQNPIATQTTTAPETELALKAPPQIFPTERQGSFDLLLNPAMFEHLQRVAKLYSSSNLVPQQYRGNIADCVIGIQMAIRLGIDPFMFLQNTYVIQGRPGMEAKLAIALVNQRGPFRGPMIFKLEKDQAGKTIACTAQAYHRNGQLCESTVTWKLVEAEGWSKKPGSKWLTMPDQMFKYRSAVFLARAYCPEVLVGMQTTEELDDTYNQTRYVEANVVEPGKTKSESVLEKLQAPSQPSEPVRETQEVATSQPQAAQTERVDKATGEVQNVSGDDVDAALGLEGPLTPEEEAEQTSMFTAAKPAPKGRKL